MRELLNRSNERWALLRRSDTQNQSLAIFVHGFRGGYLDTWGRTADLIQQHADTDAVLSQWDFLFAGYSTREVETYLDIATLLCTRWRQAAEGNPPFHARYRKLALLGHSLGTLGIRQLLCATSEHPCELLPALHSVTLFGSPINGSPWAPVGSLVYKIGDSLKATSPQMRMLKVWTKSAFSPERWPKTRVVLGLGDAVVGHASSDLIEWDGDQVDKVNLDHSDLVKPTDFHAEPMNYIRTALR